MATLRSFIFLDRLQPQTMCSLGSWIRGSLPRRDMAAQIIEVSPGIDIEALTDIALKAADVQGGILVVERQFGYLEIHSRDISAVKAAASAVLAVLGKSPGDALTPKILASQIISRIDPGHAFLINRNKGGSMILAGEALYKRALAKHARPLFWTVVFRNSAWMRVLLMARSVKSALENFHKVNPTRNVM